MGIFIRSRKAANPAKVEERSQLYIEGGGGWANLRPASSMSTMENALQSIAYRSCVDVACSLASELPMDFFKGAGQKKRQIDMPEYLEDPAGDGQGFEDFRYQAVLSWILRGNLYANVQRRGKPTRRSPQGMPVEMIFYHPDEVSGELVDGEVVWYGMTGERIDKKNFLHRRVNPVPGRIQGLSPIAFHAGSIGLSLTAAKFGEDWFNSGAHPSGLLTNDEEDLTPKRASVVKDRFMAAMRGSAEPVVLGRGWKYQQLSVSAEESQFLATQAYSEAQCARILGPGFAEIMGYESGGSMNYANITDRSVQLLTYSLNKWLNRSERLINLMLPDGVKSKINRNALLEVATMQRLEAYGLALKNRQMTVNEAREKEELPPVSWGDEPFYDNYVKSISESTSQSTSKNIETPQKGGAQ